MNQQIVKISQSTELSVKLSPRDNEVAIALTGRMIKDIDRQYLFNIFKGAINRAYLLIRYEAPIELQLIIDETMKLAQNNYGTIREGEVEIALTRGVLGDYGSDFKGLSVVTFIGFIKAYLKDEARSKLLGTPVKEYNQPDYNQIFTMSKGNALRALNDVKEKKDITLYGSIVFDWLRKIGLIDLNEYIEAEFAEDARSELYNEFSMKAEITTDKYKRREFGDIVTALIPKEDGTVDNLVAHKILSRSKCLTLKAFMEGVLLEELDLEQMIEDRRGRDTSVGETSQPIG